MLGPVLSHNISFFGGVKYLNLFINWSCKGQIFPRMVCDLLSEIRAHKFPTGFAWNGGFKL